MKEPSTREILETLTDIAETYKMCECKFSGENHHKLTKTFLDALTLKISFYNVLFGCVEAKNRENHCNKIF